jgi:hypothetical protein
LQRENCNSGAIAIVLFRDRTAIEARPAPSRRHSPIGVAGHKPKTKQTVAALAPIREN